MSFDSWYRLLNFGSPYSPSELDLLHCFLPYFLHLNSLLLPLLKIGKMRAIGKQFSSKGQSVFAGFLKAYR